MNFRGSYERNVPLAASLAAPDYLLGARHLPTREASAFHRCARYSNGNLVQGPQQAVIRLGYGYSREMACPSSSGGGGGGSQTASFGNVEPGWGNCQEGQETVRVAYDIFTTRLRYLGGFDALPLGLENWNLSPHHVYSPATGTL